MISKVKDFSHYSNQMNTIDLLNEGFLICGLCVLLSNVFDKLFTIGLANEEMTTDSTFLYFIDD